jgi:hypothetical protein
MLRDIASQTSPHSGVDQRHRRRDRPFRPTSTLPRTPENSYQNNSIQQFAAS